MQASEQIESVIVERDMDLARNLLRTIEQNSEMDRTREFFIQSSDQIGVPDQPFEKVQYHLRLLAEAGFTDGTKDGVILRGLTWDGHEFLDNIRNDDIWSKVKKQAATVSGVGLKMLAALAESEIKKHFGLS